MDENLNTDYESGLKRNLSPMNVWALAFGCMIGWEIFVMPVNSFLPNAGSFGTLLAILISVGIMLLLAVNYHYMINRYPSVGGVLTFSRMAFGKEHAFLCSWFLSLAYIAVIPLNAAALSVIGRCVCSNIYPASLHGSMADTDVYLCQILVIVLILILMGLLCMSGVQIAGRLQTGLAGMLLLGIVVLAVALILQPGISLVNLEPVYAPGKNHELQILAVITMAPLTFSGFDTISHTSEEFWFSPKKSFSIMAWAIVVGGLVYIVLTMITAAVIPEEFSNWYDYNQSIRSQSELQAVPLFYAVYQLMGNTGVVIAGMVAIAAVLTGMIGFYMAASRILFSMTADHILPPWFGGLNHHRTPGHAILFIMVVSLPVALLGHDRIEWLAELSALGMVVGFGYTSAAAYKFARAEENERVKLTGMLGVILSVFFGLLLMVPNPLAVCSLGQEAYAMLAVWSILGFVLYWRALQKW